MEMKEVAMLCRVCKAEVRFKTPGGFGIGIVGVVCDECNGEAGSA